MLLNDLRQQTHHIPNQPEGGHVPCRSRCSSGSRSSQRQSVQMTRSRAVEVAAGSTASGGFHGGGYRGGPRPSHPITQVAQGVPDINCWSSRSSGLLPVAGRGYYRGYGYGAAAVGAAAAGAAAYGAYGALQQLLRCVRQLDLSWPVSLLTRAPSARRRRLGQSLLPSFLRFCRFFE